MSTEVALSLGQANFISSTGLTQMENHGLESALRYRFVLRLAVLQQSTVQRARIRVV